MKLGMRALVLSLIPLILVALPGCSSPPPEPPGPAPVSTARLVVVVWSKHLQRAVPARGVLLSLEGGAEHEIDTRADPAGGQVVAGLEPGRYRLVLKSRLLETGANKPVKGEDEVYLEPGAERSVTVVVSDHDEDRLGRRPFSPGTSSSTLPPEPVPA